MTVTFSANANVNNQFQPARPNPALRFGSNAAMPTVVGDTLEKQKQSTKEKVREMLGGNELPKTYKAFQDERKKLEKAFSELDKPTGNLINNPQGTVSYWRKKLKFLWERRKLQKQLEAALKEGARLYLPELSKNQLFGYLKSSQLVKDWFNHGEQGLITRRIISFSGPPVVKYFQIIAQQVANKDEDALRAQIKDVEGELENRKSKLGETLHKYKNDNGKLSAKARKKEEEKHKEAQEEIDKIAHTLETLRLQVEMRHIAMPLRDKVPSVAFSVIKKDVDDTVVAYNKQFPTDPIVRVDEEDMGGGSMAQAHKAYTQSGQKRVIKVLRPEASPEYFDGYKRFSQFLLLFMLGEENANWVEEITNDLMEDYKEEIRLEREKLHGEHLAARLKQEGCDIQVPQVLATTDRAFVEEFVEGMNLADKKMKPEQQAEAMQTLAPMLVKSYLLYPEKYLDPQGGNMKWPAAIFDYGRMSMLEPKANQRVLKFIQAYLHGYGHLLCNSWEGEQWSHASKKADSIIIPALQQLVPKRLKTTDEQIDLLIKLINRIPRQQMGLGGQNIIDLGGKGIGVQGSSLFRLIYNLPSLEASGKVIPLTAQGSLFKKEYVEHGREKLRAMVQPYFKYQVGKYTEEALLQSLKTMSAEDFRKLYRSASSEFPKKLPQTFQELNWACNALLSAKRSVKSLKLQSLRPQEEGSDLTSRISKMEREKRKYEEEYKQALASALQTEDGRGFLVALSRIDKHLEALTDDVLGTLLQGARNVAKTQREEMRKMLKLELNAEFSPYSVLDE